jgi:hypothetical protein
LLDDEATRRRLGRIGRQRVEPSLAWDHQAPRYVGVFNRLLRRSSARPSGTIGSRSVAVQQSPQAAADGRR